jgi:hypothetical protein
MECARTLRSTRIRRSIDLRRQSGVSHQSLGSAVFIDTTCGWQNWQAQALGALLSTAGPVMMQKSLSARPVVTLCCQQKSGRLGTPTQLTTVSLPVRDENQTSGRLVAAISSVIHCAAGILRAAAAVLLAMPTHLAAGLDQAGHDRPAYQTRRSNNEHPHPIMLLRIVTRDGSSVLRLTSSLVSG